MRRRRQVRVLERILDATTLLELFAGSARDRRDVRKVLDAVIARGLRVEWTVQTVGRLRGVTSAYVVDRVAVLDAWLEELQRHDPFLTLGVTPAATAEEIRRRWRVLAKTAHPDVARDERSEARFRRLRAAYDVLRDPDRRMRYEVRQRQVGGQIIWELPAPGVRPPGEGARPVPGLDSDGPRAPVSWMGRLLGFLG